jgi:protein SCO1/2
MESRLTFWSVPRSRLPLVAAALVLGPQAAASGDVLPVGDHGGHGHHHHQAAGDVERSLESYAPPDVTLRDQEGLAVRLRDLLATDRPVLLNFIFTSCTAICPAMSATFARVQDELGGDRERVRMLSISIDPEHDSSQRLAAYAERLRAGPQWRFLTGSLEDCVAVQKAFDAYRGDKAHHAPLTLVRPAAGARWVRYEGFASASDLVKSAIPEAGASP